MKTKKLVAATVGGQIIKAEFPIFTIGKTEIGKLKNHEGKNQVFLSHDGEGMAFDENEFEELLKEILYKFF